MSYVRSDDARGLLTEFREKLSAEVRMQTGEEFPIFQDRNDILWGQNWDRLVKKSITTVTFLIPLITPSFFNSPACRGELQQFLEKEKTLNRDDLVLPVYYIDCPLLHDKEKLKKDKLAQIIANREYADWRELRFEPFTSSTVGKRLADLAVQIRDALERVKASQKTSGARSAKAREASVSRLAVTESEIEGLDTGIASTITSTPIRVVDPLYRGDYTTITEAIEAANPGDRIIVRPGLYQEGLIVEKPLEIIGEGELVSQQVSF